MNSALPSGRTRVSELVSGDIRSYTINPEDLGVPLATIEDLLCDTPEECAAAIREVLEGKKGPKRDIVLLNAAAALMMGDAATDLADGLKQAADLIDSGAAASTLEKLVGVSNS